jgi:hypothetical protein
MVRVHNLVSIVDRLVNLTFKKLSGSAEIAPNSRRSRLQYLSSFAQAAPENQVSDTSHTPTP